MYISKVLV